ncbi:UV radiation resistance protein [Phlyctema vagabunda]|uniref:Autophagy-related protein 14 n=1 Tax=Phlyctema vagabunda TaxID=108571 RepID=A0ABR4PQS9_9HELO
MAAETSRPLLLPQNRRLRHLKGIYIRNLTLTRPRGRTIDDGALNKSPQKLDALREPQLHHAHSSEDLRPKVRRRSTTNWVNASAGIRQKKLEDVMASRMADTFFSLHCEGQDDPVYISEVVEKAMNPTFRFFDLSTYGPATTRLNRITIKIWAKRQSEFTALLEETIDLKSLQFIGKLENHPFPANCILFHLTDGIYTLDFASPPPRPKPAPALPTSSYNALMRLSNLDESIQDALATREELATQINAILNDTPVDESPQAAEATALAVKYVNSERKLLKQSVRRRTELESSIESRRSAIKDGMEIQNRTKEDVANAQGKLQSCRDLLQATNEDMRGQRRRICEDLLNIFPIESTEHPLLFTICGLLLPNSDFDESNENVVAAALSYVARVVDLLQYYLSVPLPYPVTVVSSKSLVHDHISILSDNQRTFPLYMKGTVRFRFDYAVFLLNKNIQCLAYSQGLKVIDIRHTLPNLKYLLYVCASGTSDLPARKAGGVKGLVAGQETPNQSRRGSLDSGNGELVRKALENGSNGSKPASLPPANLPSPLEHRHSLRTSGLRENVQK